MGVPTALLWLTPRPRLWCGCSAHWRLAGGPCSPGWSAARRAPLATPPARRRRFLLLAAAAACDPTSNRPSSRAASSPASQLPSCRIYKSFILERQCQMLQCQKR